MIGPWLAMSSALLLAGCTSASQRPLANAETKDLMWPASPAEPRIAYVMSFTGAEDLGIKKRFLQRLRVFVGGKSEERLVRPMAVVEIPGKRYFVADPGVRGVHLFDRHRGSYQLIRRENDEPLPSPVGLAAGPLGEVYVTDSRLAGLFIIGPGADVATRIPIDAILAQPTGVAVTPGWWPWHRVRQVQFSDHDLDHRCRGLRSIGFAEFQDANVRCRW